MGLRPTKIKEDALGKANIRRMCGRASLTERFPQNC